MIRRIVFCGSLLGLLFLLVVSRKEFWSKTTNVFGGERYNSSSKWSSLLTVDPSTIVGHMIQHGGLFVSPSIDRDLKTVAKFCAVESSQLNVLERTLVLHNLTVRLPPKDGFPEDNAALWVKKIVIQWDSYFQPCVELQVEDVFVGVEFFNVLLTQNNWMILNQQGFPPTFAEEEEPSSTTKGDSDSEDDSFVRIGSVAFSGNVRLLVRSKPMQHTISNVTFSMKKLRAFENAIQRESAKNEKTSGRRGCTTTTLYELIEEQTKKVIQKGVENLLADLALENGKDTKATLRAIQESAKQTLQDYLRNAGEWSERQLQQTIDNYAWGGESSDDKDGGDGRKKLLDRMKRLGSLQETIDKAWGESSDDTDGGDGRRKLLDRMKRLGLAQLRDVINITGEDIKEYGEL